MKIVVVTMAYYPSLGGAENALREVVKGLSREHEVVVYSSYFNAKDAPHELVVDGVKVKRFNHFSSYLFSPQLVHAIFNEKPGLFLAYGFGRFHFDAVSHIAKMRGIPCAAITSGYYHTAKHSTGKKLYSALVARRSLNSYDALITFTQGEKDFWVKHFHVPASKIHVIPLALQDDFAQFKEQTKALGKIAGKQYFCFIGRLAANKRVDLAIHALPEIPALHFAIVGPDAGFKQKHEQLAHKLGVHERVHFLGSMSEEEKKTVLAHSQFFCLPTDYESFGLVALESFSLGKPVAASDIYAMREIIDEGKTGYLFGHSQESVVTALRKTFMLAKKPETRAACLATARKYSLAHMNALYGKLVVEVAHKKKR